jgi:hypothetical protein
MSTQPVAPDVNMSSTPNSALVNAIASAPPPQAPVLNESGTPDGGAGASGEAPPTPAAPGGRLAAVLGAVAKVTSTAMSGIPAGNRPSFAGGLGQGARAEQAAQANEQAIKFASFQDSVRAANLHNQDLQKQAADDAQQKAQQAAEDFQNEELGKNGGSIDTHPNDGTAVMQTLQGQTAANGAASITPGTHISADGKNINVPSNTPQTLAAQVQNYKSLEGVLPGLPALPAFDPSSVKTSQDVTNARAELGRHLDIQQHLLQGYNVDGSPYTHQQLNDLIPAYQAQIDSLTKNGGASDYQIGTLKNTLAILQANEQHHSDTEDEVADKVAQQKAAQAGAVAGAQSQAKLPSQIALQDNAAANKPKPDNTELNSVAFDPTYQNPDGSTGANVVMSKADVAAKGLPHYKADPAKLNATVAGFNDVQNKINMLADVANDPNRMGKVQPDVAAALMESGDGVQLGAFGTKIDMTKINANIYANNMEKANQATKDYVTAMLGAHEAITQLPRLQTFGQSSRMTQQQMEAAQKLLPQPGDASVARQKMTALQQMLDPLRKQVPRMPGAEQIPSWLEKQSGQ